VQAASESGGRTELNQDPVYVVVDCVCVFGRRDMEWKELGSER